jgi:hypothetical protein
MENRKGIIDNGLFVTGKNAKNEISWTENGYK